MKEGQEIYGIRAILEAIVQEQPLDKIWLLKVFPTNCKKKNQTQVA